MSSSEPQGSRQRDSDRKTRVHLSIYDRTKFILLFVFVYLVLVWASLAGNPLLSISDAFNEITRTRTWLLLLVVIEILRQMHFLVSEIVVPYHGIWQKYFQSVDFALHRLSDWTRYRLSRIIKTIIFIALLSVVLGAIYKETPVRALFLAPSALWRTLAGEQGAVSAVLGVGVPAADRGRDRVQAGGSFAERRLGPAARAVVVSDLSCARAGHLLPRGMDLYPDDP